MARAVRVLATILTAAGALLADGRGLLLAKLLLLVRLGLQRLLLGEHVLERQDLRQISA